MPKRKDIKKIMIIGLIVVVRPVNLTIPAHKHVKL